MPAEPARRSDPWSFLRFLLFLGIASFILRSFIFAPFVIPSASMQPELMVGDYLFVTKWNYGFSRYSLAFNLPLIDGRVLARLPRRGDVVVFKYPGPDKVDYVKRVIGIPGDRIAVRGGVPIVDGRAVGRDRIADWPMRITANSPCRVQGENVRQADGTCFYPRYRETLRGGRSYDVLDQGTGRLDEAAEVTVPDGHVFVMGDNRDDSLDSRVAVAERGVGLVPVDHLVGRAALGFFSTDGSADILKPWTWWPAARPERIGAVH